MLGQTVFQTVVAMTGALGSALAALAYFHNVRLPRPAVGVFHGRDVITLLGLITVLPLLYLAVPVHVLTGFLVITFVSALSIGLRPVLPTRWVVAVVAGLIAGNIIVTYTLLGTGPGHQLYWALGSSTVLLAVVSISNLNVQGGLRVVHVARFAVALAFYDVFFAVVVPITPSLADAFEGQPLSPSIGYALAPYSANIGMGDLLVYCLAVLAVTKGFGRRAGLVTLTVVGVFGALLPSLTPAVLETFTRNDTGVVVPAQLFFGPAFYGLYRVLSRRHPELSMARWTADRQVATIARPTPLAAAPARAGLPVG